MGFSTPVSVAGYNREDIAVLDCAFTADTDTTGTITNGTDFTFRNLSGVLVAPIAVIITLKTTAAGPTPLCGVVAGTDVTITKVSLTNSVCTFRVFLFGPKSKGIA